MTSLLRPAFVLVSLFTLLLGLAVPLAFTGIAGAVFPVEAGGSLVSRDGKVIGSVPVGQAFATNRYFHPRPSATSAAPYDAAAGAASQLGPTSGALLEAARGRVAELGGAPVPADAATASGSGLDPDISPANAASQVARIAMARGLPQAAVAALVSGHVEERPLGLLGEKRVNVLRLNLALDALR